MLIKPGLLYFLPNKSRVRKNRLENKWRGYDLILLYDEGEAKARQGSPNCVSISVINLAPLASVGVSLPVRFHLQRARDCPLSARCTLLTNIPHASGSFLLHVWHLATALRLGQTKSVRNSTPDHFYYILCVAIFCFCFFICVFFHFVIFDVLFFISYDFFIYISFISCFFMYFIFISHFFMYFFFHFVFFKCIFSFSMLLCHFPHRAFLFVSRERRSSTLPSANVISIQFGAGERAIERGLRKAGSRKAAIHENIAY